MPVQYMHFLFNVHGEMLSSYTDDELKNCSELINRAQFQSACHTDTFTSADFASVTRLNGKVALSTVINGCQWSGFLVPMLSHMQDVSASKHIMLTLTLTAEAVPAAQAENSFDRDLLFFAASPTYCIDPRQKKILNVTANIGMLTGFSPDEILQQPEGWVERIHPDDRKKFNRHLEFCQSSCCDDICGIEYRFRHRLGHYIWLADRSRAIFDLKTQAPVLLVGSLADISDVMRMYNQLVSLTAVAPGMIFQYERDPEGQICFSYMSPQVESLFGHTADEVKQDVRLLFSAVHPVDRKRVYRSLVKAEKRQHEWKCEFRVLNHGEVRWLYGHAVVVNRSGDRQLWSGLLIDISDKKSLEFKLKRESTTDPLTGLFNRRYFMSVLGEVFDSGIKGQLPVSILAIDFDHFKQVNDKHGHDIGDKVLRLVAAGMKQNLRKTDTLARIGGEEFSVILPATTYSDAQKIGEKLRQYVESMRVPCQDFYIQITITIGVASSDGNLSQKEILISADRALYKGKSSGRNCVV